MQTVILGILGFIFVMGLAVLVHEIGHFIAARKFGVLCHQFAIGMGPTLWKKRKGETLYKICAIPIGGYVMMGMDEGERNIIKEGTEIGLTLDHDGHVVKIHIQPEEGQLVATLISNTFDISTELQIAVRVAGERKIYPVDPEAWYIDTLKDQAQQIVPNERRLEKKPKLQRFIIMVAGAVMNFILAYILVVIVGAFLGEPVGLSSQLDFVNQDAPAYEAGLRAGDQILEIDGVEITDGSLISEGIQAAGADEMIVVFERAGVIHETIVTPMAQHGNYVIGIQIAPYLEHSFAGTFRYANSQFRNGFMLIVDTLRMLGTGEAGVQDLSGPVGIAHMTSQFAVQGFLPLLVFASLININLGIFNLLPLPALDGGHITFIIIEAILGKPVNSKIQNGIAFTGFILFMGLFVFTFFNDILRFFIR
jgi:regulator of sigma E protease